MGESFTSTCRALRSSSSSRADTSGSQSPDGYGLSAVSVAAGRVYEDAVHGFHLLQMADAVCVADGDVVQAEDREVVCGYLAEGFLALDVSGMPEAGGEIGAVDAETSGEVGKGAG